MMRIHSSLLDTVQSAQRFWMRDMCTSARSISLPVESKLVPLTFPELPKPSWGNYCKRENLKMQPRYVQKQKKKPGTNNINRNMMHPH